MVFPRLTGLTYALTVLFFSEGYYYFRSLRREFENLFSSICLHPNISLKLKKKWDGMGWNLYLRRGPHHTGDKTMKLLLLLFFFSR